MEDVTQALVAFCRRQQYGPVRSRQVKGDYANGGDATQTLTKWLVLLQFTIVLVWEIARMLTSIHFTSRPLVDDCVALIPDIANLPTVRGQV